MCRTDALAEGFSRRVIRQVGRPLGPWHRMCFGQAPIRASRGNEGTVFHLDRAVNRGRSMIPWFRRRTSFADGAAEFSSPGYCTDAEWPGRVLAFCSPSERSPGTNKRAPASFSGHGRSPCSEPAVFGKLKPSRFDQGQKVTSRAFVRLKPAPTESRYHAWKLKVSPALITLPGARLF